MTREVVTAQEDAAAEEKDDDATAGKNTNPFRTAKSAGISVAISIGLCGFGYSGWKEFRSLNINLGLVSLTLALGNIKNNIEILSKMAKVIFDVAAHFNATASGLAVHAAIEDKLLLSAVSDERNEFLRKSRTMLPYVQEIAEYLSETPFPEARIEEIDTIWRLCKQETFFADEFGGEDEDPALLDISMMNLDRTIARASKAEKSGEDTAKTKRGRGLQTKSQPIAEEFAENPVAKKRRRAERAACAISGAAKS